MGLKSTTMPPHHVDSILQISHAFLKTEEDEDIISIRYLAASGLVLVITDRGHLKKFYTTESESTHFSKLILDIQSAVKDDITDTRKLLGYGLMWLIADVYGVSEIWDTMLHPSAAMFGIEGGSNIMAFKNGLLAGDLSTNIYSIDAIHQIDLPNRVIVSDFNCLLKGKEGRGTEVMKFDENWKVIRIDAVRH